MATAFKWWPPLKQTEYVVVVGFSFIFTLFALKKQKRKTFFLYLLHLLFSSFSTWDFITKHAHIGKYFKHTNENFLCTICIIKEDFYLILLILRKHFYFNVCKEQQKILKKETKTQKNYLLCCENLLRRPCLSTQNQKIRRQYTTEDDNDIKHNERNEHSKRRGD